MRLKCIILFLKPNEHPRKDLRVNAHSVVKYGLKVWTAGIEQRVKVNSQRQQKIMQSTLFKLLAVSLIVDLQRLTAV